jgi:hypothetical protein
MPEDAVRPDPNAVIAIIENEKDPTQIIEIQYVGEENAFVTSGIRMHFDEMEILIPAYLVIKDFQLIGAIVSTILERLSEARDREGSFQYAPRFDALDKTYTLAPYGDYMKLSEAAD